MPLFQVQGSELTLVRPDNFKVEKALQHLIERNLPTVFNCRFIASEFTTGLEHAGRIDTLALSEDDNPVLIEYKKVESSELVNQGLYYLAWLNDHRGDFELAATRKLGSNTKIDWSDIRVICIAPGFKKFDLHAVKMMGTNIELWQYRLFGNGTLYFEEVFRKSTHLLGEVGVVAATKNPTMVMAGKKSAVTRATGNYSFEAHLQGIDDRIRELILELREFIMGLSESVEEAPKKHYLAYKVAQNFVCLEIKKGAVTLFLKLSPDEINPLPSNARNVRDIGHRGTGDLELTVRTSEEAKDAQQYIKMAFERIGG